MNNRSFVLLSLTACVFAPSAVARAQAPDPSPAHTRPRTVSAAQARPTATPVVTQTPAQGTAPARVTAPPSTTQQPAGATAPAQEGQAQSPAVFVPAVPLKPAQPISYTKFRARVADAQRLLKSRLTLTASSTPPLTIVTLAALDPDTSRVHLLTLPKETFLRRGSETVMTTNEGLTVRLQVLRPNYVNTAVVVSEAATGRQLTPLVVEYPIEKFGRFREMAYYTSAHPALLSPDLVKHGQSYVRNMLDLAAKRLKDKGKVISPELVDIAERLCVVEHVDHGRFRAEDRKRLYEEVYALFALNELDTYRYSVSSAGAGGMVQMIPATYATVRRMHPSVGLNPDFVAGMRNHGNAL
ncbi:MAG TPA: hypothetical protein VD968_13210, partial [Pyrinomonadaceae bacterium]|nr:hypothetical protein [Pyrinomonadaceae bacterium]